ncbi:MAG: hypothetical protein ABI670_15995 [Chloroflexota bacterium]
MAVRIDVTGLTPSTRRELDTFAVKSYAPLGRVIELIVERIYEDVKRDTSYRPMTPHGRPANFYNIHCR